MNLASFHHKKGGGGVRFHPLLGTRYWRVFHATLSSRVVSTSLWSTVSPADWNFMDNRCEWHLEFPIEVLRPSKIWRILFIDVIERNIFTTFWYEHWTSKPVLVYNIIRFGRFSGTKSGFSCAVSGRGWFVHTYHYSGRHANRIWIRYSWNSFEEKLYLDSRDIWIFCFHIILFNLEWIERTDVHYIYKITSKYFCFTLQSRRKNLKLKPPSHIAC